MENNNCHFQVGSLVTANFSWQLALPISIGANFGHNPYRVLEQWFLTAALDYFFAALINPLKIN